MKIKSYNYEEEFLFYETKVIKLGEKSPNFIRINWYNYEVVITQEKL